MVDHARIDCGRSWVRVKPKSIILILAAFPISTHRQRARAKMGLLENRMCMCLVQSGHRHHLSESSGTPRAFPQVQNTLGERREEFRMLFEYQS
jgi:hypothetical protein